MAKRFTATDKWIDPWFCNLSPKDKLFWVYLLDNCNHAGIWQVNWPLVKFHIKDYSPNLKLFNQRILVINEEKWFIPKFIDFQYGELNPENRAHKSVIDILEKEGAYKGLNSPLEGAKDKDKDKDKDNIVSSYKDNKIQYNTPPTLEEITNYCKERKSPVNPKTFFDYFNEGNWIDSKGNKVKSWKQKVITWEKQEKDNNKPTKPGAIEWNTH